MTNDVHNDSVPQPMAVWTSLSTPKQTNNLMTGNPFILSHRTYKQAGQITVPAQTARKLKINYSLINPQNNATNWDYEVQLPGTWEMGNCYTYNFRINMYTIDLNSVVAPWDFEIDEDF